MFVILFNFHRIFLSLFFYQIIIDFQNERTGSLICLDNTFPTSDVLDFDAAMFSQNSNLDQYALIQKKIVYHCHLVVD